MDEHKKLLIDQVLELEDDVEFLRYLFNLMAKSYIEIDPVNAKQALRRYIIQMGDKPPLEFMDKIEDWMDIQFESDMGKRPIDVARQAMRRYEIGSNLLPLLIKRSQYRKHKIYVRRLRQRKKSQPH